MKLPSFQAINIAAFFVLLLQVVEPLFGPGQHQQGQRGDHQENWPCKAQQGAQQGQQTKAGAQPDHHLAVAVHAREGGDNRNKQAQAENGGRVGQQGKAHGQHDVLRCKAAPRGLPKGADQRHGHHHRDQHDQGGAKAAREFFADGRME